MTLDEGGWRRPAVTVIALPAELHGIVELFWIDEWSAAEASARRFRVVLTHLPAIQFTDRSVSLLELVGPTANRTIRRMATDSPAAGIERLASLIPSLPARRSVVDPRAAWIGALDRDRRSNVADLEHALGMPGRTLRAWSVAHLGMGLKRLLRIRRLHAERDAA